MRGKLRPRSVQATKLFYLLAPSIRYRSLIHNRREISALCNSSSRRHTAEVYLASSSLRNGTTDDIRQFLTILLLILPAVPAVAQSAGLMGLNDVGVASFCSVPSMRGIMRQRRWWQPKSISPSAVSWPEVVKQHFVNPTADWLEGRYVRCRKTRRSTG